MAKNPDHLGNIYINDYEGQKRFGGKAFDVPEAVPVMFIKGSFVSKEGKNAGQTVEYLRVMKIKGGENDDHECVGAPPF